LNATDEEQASELKIDLSGPDQPFNIFFEEVGYQTKYLIANLGSTFLYLVAILVLLIFIPLLEAIGVKRVEPFKKKLIWNGVIRFIIQQYPPMILCSGINMFALEFK